jgi:outer membrane receptor protein involved in Fe transport
MGKFLKRRRSPLAATLALLFAVPGTSVGAVAQTTGATLTSNAVTISGRITDSRNLPIAGAVITARGSTMGWTATRLDGSYVMTVAAGSYDLLVRKGGYTPGTMAVVVGNGASKVMSLSLAEANLSSVGLGNVKSVGAPFNIGVAATATMSDVAISERPSLSLRELALELPGVTLAHPDDNVPDTSFVVRGGTVETRVNIDGHPVSAGATGRWNSSYASLPLLDSVEVVKGPSLSGANAGESAFGTINLRTRDFTRGHQEDVAIGQDSFGGNYANFALSGTLLKDDRLSYVLEHNLYGYNGPQAHHLAYNVITEPNGTALVAGQTPLDSPLMLGSDLAKLRWRFSGTTSLTVGYVGLHSDYDQTGGAYATFVGNRTIIPSAPGQLFGKIVTQPAFSDLVGKTVPAYTLSDSATAQINQPLFEAEFRTAIKNDTLLVRPYAGTIYHVVDGSSFSSGDPSTGGNWTTVTTGPGCSPATPCFEPVSGSALFRDQENDRLWGTTATLVHPIGDATFNLSFDTRSDSTTQASGNPSVKFDGSPLSMTGYQDSIPATVARNNDWSATYTLPLTSRLRLFAADYYTRWNLDYASITLIPDFNALRISQIIANGQRKYSHNDPQFGLTWHPESDTTFRFSAGSAITVPYAALVSGQISANSLFNGGQVGFPNAALQPETTFAYNLGADHRFSDGSVLAVDAFDNTIHNVFATRNPVRRQRLGHSRRLAVYQRFLNDEHARQRADRAPLRTRTVARTCARDRFGLPGKRDAAARVSRSASGFVLHFGEQSRERETA